MIHIHSGTGIEQPQSINMCFWSAQVWKVVEWWRYVHVSERDAQAWIELATLEGPDYFGEAAMLSRGLRHATVIADCNVEILVLTKVDFDLKIDREARDVVSILVSNYPKDKVILQCA